MKKYILFIIIALCCASGAMAQSMTDNQVIDFVMKETKKGTSQAQIVTKLMQRGVNISQIRRVKKMYDRLQKGSGLGTVSSGSSEKT
ncbi:MAG: capsule biosynthesis protein, partial [Prevotella sp.]|nr:capsule biosynthesis protein [Prevotella sp.]